MKKFKYGKEFKAADGQPFTVLNPDVLVQRKAREEAMEAGKKKGLSEMEISWQAPTIDCDFAQAITWFMNHIPFSDGVDGDGKLKAPRKLTPEDAGNAYAVIKAFQDIKSGYVEMEDAVYAWLMEIVKTDGIEAFRPLATQAIVTERLQDVIKEEKKASTKS